MFAVWAGPGPPPKQQKKKAAPAQTAKKITPEKPKQQKRPDNKKINTLTGLYRGYDYRGYIEIMENTMETTVMGYIGVILHGTRLGQGLEQSEEFIASS